MRTVSLEEVQQHLTEDGGGVWVIIDGLVYDVTEWHEDHPGGSEILLELAGKDATKLFAAVQHSPDAIEQRLLYSRIWLFGNIIYHVRITKISRGKI